MDEREVLFWFHCALRAYCHEIEPRVGSSAKPIRNSVRKVRYKKAKPTKHQAAASCKKSSETSQKPNQTKGKQRKPNNPGA